MPERATYAPWWRRVVATVVDLLPVVVLAVVAVALVWVTRNPLCDGDPSVRDLGPQCGDSGATTLGLWCFVACWSAIVGYALWNVGLRQGRSGSSLGKGLLGIRVLDATTLQPIGFWRSVIRHLTHLADVVPVGVGFLWPLWDRRSQTFADKLSSTVVSGTR
ncbi:RDD family protein [Mycobacterium hodleri]|nr:RDD family protein [Mycolicibacterium hodleri]